MSSNAEIPRSCFGDSLQLTNWILDSGATCYTTPEISNFIPGSLAETEKYTKVSNGNYVTAKQKVGVQIKMRDNNGKNFIATLYMVLLAPDLCDQLFSIIKFMNLLHT